MRQSRIGAARTRPVHWLFWYLVHNAVHTGIPAIAVLREVFEVQSYRPEGGRVFLSVTSYSWSFSCPWADISFYWILNVCVQSYVNSAMVARHCLQALYSDSFWHVFYGS